MRLGLWERRLPVLGRLPTVSAEVQRCGQEQAREGCISTYDNVTTQKPWTLLERSMGRGEANLCGWRCGTCGKTRRRNSSSILSAAGEICKCELDGGECSSGPLWGSLVEILTVQRCWRRGKVGRRCDRTSVWQTITPEPPDTPHSCCCYLWRLFDSTHAVKKNDSIQHCSSTAEAGVLSQRRFRHQMIETGWF